MKFTKILVLAAALATLCAVQANASKTLYADTLSTPGRAADSTAFQAAAPGKQITLGFKVEGNATGGVNRIAVCVRWHLAGTVDSTNTWAASERMVKISNGGPSSAAITNIGSYRNQFPDSIAQATGGTSAVPWPNEVVLSFLSSGSPTVGWHGKWIPMTFTVPEGFSGWSITFRIISQSSAQATGPIRLRIVRA